MDEEFLKDLPTHLGSIAEICCGHGEALLLLKDRYE
jgi:tRNA1(Val) A37 N6-methylase TrmN6